MSQEDVAAERDRLKVALVTAHLKPLVADLGIHPGAAGLVAEKIAAGFTLNADGVLVNDAGRGIAPVAAECASSLGYVMASPPPASGGLSTHGFTVAQLRSLSPRERLSVLNGERPHPTRKRGR